MSVLWHLAVAMPMLLALSGAALAQAGDTQMLKDKDAAEGKAVRQLIDRMETDEQYQKTIHSQASVPASNDPWGNVRAATTPANGAKPGAKSVTKTASGSGKSAAIKPASTKSTTPKGQ